MRSNAQLKVDDRPVLTASGAASAEVAHSLLARFAASGAKFHGNGSYDWSASGDMIRFLATHTPLGGDTLETGRASPPSSSRHSAAATLLSLPIVASLTAFWLFAKEKGSPAAA